MHLGGNPSLNNNDEWEDGFTPTRMPKKAPEPGPLAVSRPITPGLHFVGGVAGLALQVTDSGARSWILRAKMGGKRRDKGLGGFPDVSITAGAFFFGRPAREPH